MPVCHDLRVLGLIYKHFQALGRVMAGNVAEFQREGRKYRMEGSKYRKEVRKYRTEGRKTKLTKGRF